MFHGRIEELQTLEDAYRGKKSKIVALYGRRRTGKSCLIKQFSKGKPFLTFEGIENEDTPFQVRSFLNDFSKQINDPLLARVRGADWISIFDRLTKFFSDNKNIKIVVLFDELQWMAAQHTTLIALIKKYWDQDWKNQNVLLVLCGSVSSFMVKKVIKSKALYGRIDHEISLQEMPFKDVRNFLKKRDPAEAFKYYLLFGGIPKYWELLTPSASFDKNVLSLLFQKDGFLFNDFEKIFYSQFKEPKKYEAIITLLEKPLNLQEIAEGLNESSSGSLLTYLENLEIAGFIQSYRPYNKQHLNKLKKYRVCDAYLRSYIKYVKVVRSKILRTNFKQAVLPSSFVKSWPIWIGLAFENYCQKNGMLMAKIMGFEDKVIGFGPYFSRGDVGFQIDLVFERSDKVLTVCEIKCYSEPVSTLVIKEVEEKIKLLPRTRGVTIEKALISLFGASKSLADTGFFDHSVSLIDFY